LIPYCEKQIIVKQGPKLASDKLLDVFSYSLFLLDFVNDIIKFY